MQCPFRIEIELLLQNLHEMDLRYEISKQAEGFDTVCNFLVFESGRTHF